MIYPGAKLEDIYTAEELKVFNSLYNAATEISEEDEEEIRKEQLTKELS